MNLHEQAFVESFVQRARRERVRLAFANPKKRRKFINEFALHGTYILAPECLRSIKPNQQHQDSIYAILRSLGAPDSCYLISEDNNLDGKEMELSAALKQIVGYGMGTVISCLPGQLGYFEGELRERYILQK
ncbi:MAG: hypothetical protein WBE45_14575 [Terriglobales bacterium]|jgi:hypothetical protein